MKVNIDSIREEMSADRVTLTVNTVRVSDKTFSDIAIFQVIYDIMDKQHNLNISGAILRQLFSITDASHRQFCND